MEIIQNILKKNHYAWNNTKMPIGINRSKSKIQNDLLKGFGQKIQKRHRFKVG